MKEFRFVISKETLDNLKIDSSGAKDFIDYYIERNKRVRHSLGKPGKEEFALISGEPGMTFKRKIAISRQEAEILMKQAKIIVKKQGIGHIHVSGIEGYCEKVAAINAETEKIILEEVQIEFEQSQDKIKILEREIKPSGVINKGLYDYISERA